MQNLVSNTGAGLETSLATYADAAATAVSATGKLKLVVGSATFNLDVTGANNLNGLVNAINTSGAGVTASVTGSAGNYSLSIAAPGATTIKLNDLQTPVALVSNTNPGSNADFYLNGSIHVTRSSNTVSDVIPGVSFMLKNTTTPTGSVTLSLASDPSQLGNALQSLVTDYNSLATAVTGQRGKGAGPLAGDPLINQISADMQQLVTYWNPTSTSSVRSLSDLGITFNYSGQLSFDAASFASLSDTQIADAYKFLGSATSGLGALASNFTQLSDPLTGLIQAEEAGYTKANKQLDAQITAANAKVAAIQASATAQAQAADALVAQLQSKQNAVDASIQGLNYVLYGKSTGANGL